MITGNEIAEGIIAQLDTITGPSSPLLPRAFTRVLAKVLGAVFALMYRYVDAGVLQVFVKTCSGDDMVISGQAVNPLRFWGDLIGTSPRRLATSAELSVSLTVGAGGGILPAFSPMVGALNRVTYLTTEAVALTAGAVLVTVRATAEQAGAAGNLPDGSTINLVNAPAAVNPRATVASAVVTGADAESIESYRQRVVDRFQRRPQGGAFADYELWGEEVAGIVNVYPYKSANPGQVDLYCEATPASSGSADGFPTTPQLNAVLAAVELDTSGMATRRPVGALVNALSITRTAYDVIVTGLLVDDAPTVQASIATALTDYFLGRAPHIPGLTTPPRADRITVSAVGAIVEVVAASAGGTVDTIEIEVAATPTPVSTLGVGEKCKLGVLSFVA
jgi:uncharacterized phage protein gp47/JayE